MTNPVDINKFDPNSISSPARAVMGPVNTGSVTFDQDYSTSSQFARWIYIGTTGNLSYVKYNGATETLPNIAAGLWHPICSIRINSVGTTITANQLRWGD